MTWFDLIWFDSIWFHQSFDWIELDWIGLDWTGLRFGNPLPNGYNLRLRTLGETNTPQPYGFQHSFKFSLRALFKASYTILQLESCSRNVIIWTKINLHFLSFKFHWRWKLASTSSTLCYAVTLVTQYQLVKPAIWGVCRTKEPFALISDAYSYLPGRQKHVL